jgi:hypothetical protein
VCGGESSGAGIGVPSVRERLMGVNVSGLYLPMAMMDRCECLECASVEKGQLSLRKAEQGSVDVQQRLGKNRKSRSRVGAQEVLCKRRIDKVDKVDE